MSFSSEIVSADNSVGTWASLWRILPSPNFDAVSIQGDELRISYDPKRWRYSSEKIKPKIICLELFGSAVSVVTQLS